MKRKKNSTIDLNVYSFTSFQFDLKCNLYRNTGKASILSEFWWHIIMKNLNFCIAYILILIQVSSINRVLKKIQHDWNMEKHMHQGNHIYFPLYILSVDFEL